MPDAHGVSSRLLGPSPSAERPPGCSAPAEPRPSPCTSPTPRSEGSTRWVSPALIQQMLSPCEEVVTAAAEVGRSVCPCTLRAQRLLCAFVYHLAGLSWQVCCGCLHRGCLHRGCLHRGLTAPALPAGWRRSWRRWRTAARRVPPRRTWWRRRRRPRSRRQSPSPTRRRWARPRCGQGCLLRTGRRVSIRSPSARPELVLAAGAEQDAGGAVVALDPSGVTWPPPCPCRPWSSCPAGPCARGVGVPGSGWRVRSSSR